MPARRLRHAEQRVDLRKHGRQRAALAQHFEEHVGCARSPARVASPARRVPAPARPPRRPRPCRASAASCPGAMREAQVAGSAPRAARCAGSAPGPPTKAGETWRNTRASRSAQPSPGIHEAAVGRARDRVDGEVAALQVFFERHLGRGVHHETPVARRRLALGARERVLLVGIRVQEYGEVAAHCADSPRAPCPPGCRRRRSSRAHRPAGRATRRAPRRRPGKSPCAHCTAARPLADIVAAVRRILPSITLLLILVGTLPLPGCATLGYYGQAVAGHLDLISARTPIEDVIADPAHARGGPRAAARGRARGARVRDHASLACPDNGSYTRYVQLEQLRGGLQRVRRAGVLAEAEDVVLPGGGLRRVPRLFQQGRGGPLRGALRRCRATTPGSVRARRRIRRSGASRIRSSRRCFIATMRASGELLFHELAHQLLYVKGDSGIQRGLRDRGRGRGRAPLARPCRSRTKNSPSWEAFGRTRVPRSSCCLRAPAAACRRLYSSDVPEAKKCAPPRRRHVPRNS
jgi:hypothetical protein